MGQRLRTAQTTKPGRTQSTSVTPTLQLAVFETELGWFGLLGENNSAIRLYIGHQSPVDLQRKLSNEFANASIEDVDWNSQLRCQLEDYACGIPVDFAKADVHYPSRTPFQTRVVAATRRIPYGQTASYASLALAAGSPRAARAVGTVMSSNPLPIFVPCHRVVASGGKLGGFSAPQGLSLKKRMLELESIANS